MNITHKDDNLPEYDDIDTIIIENSEMLDNPFTEAVVAKAISSLKKQKAPGEDNILNEYIKLASDALIMFYTNLVNTVFETGEVSESWTTGLIVPIYKKGDPTNPSNYRCIALLSALGKACTKLLNNRLERFS